MSKGMITSGGTDGKYNVTVDMLDGPDVSLTDCYCADLTENLSGAVGVIEIAGDQNKGANIQPGHDDNAVYDKIRDGELKTVQPFPRTQPTQEVYWNWAMRAGWQKHRPNYRYGTITNLDQDDDICDVTLDDCYATDMPDGKLLPINKEELLQDVPIEYMDCNAAAFEDGDKVLVKFEDNDWAKPKVIGFESEPKGCGVFLYLFGSGKVVVWNLHSNAVAENIKDNSGNDIISWPVDESIISNWYDNKSIYTENVALWDGPTQIRFTAWQGSGDNLYHENRFGLSTKTLTSGWLCYDGSSNGECAIEDPSHWIEIASGVTTYKLEGDVYTAQNGSLSEIEVKRTKDDVNSSNSKCYGSLLGTSGQSTSFSTKVHYPFLDVEVGGSYYNESRSCECDDCVPGSDCDCDLGMPGVDASEAAKLSDFEIMGTYHTPSSGDGEWIWFIAVGKIDLANDEYEAHAVCSRDVNVTSSPTGLPENAALTALAQGILNASDSGDLAYKILK